MIKVTFMKFFIGACFFMHFQAYGMLPAEQELIDNIRNPVVTSTMNSLTTRNDLRRAHLLGFKGWGQATEDFIQALEQDIHTARMYVVFQRFMLGSVPQDPSYERRDNPDGSSFFIKRIKNNDQNFCIVQSSLQPDVIRVINLSLSHSHSFPSSTVYPVFKNEL